MYKNMLKEKLASQASLMKLAIDEKRAMTEDEQTQFDALDVEIKNIEKTIDAQAKIEARKVEDETIVTQPIYAEPKDHKKLWASNGEFLKAVQRAGNPSERTIDPRLLIQNAAASGASENVDADGGFLVGQDLASELLKKTQETGILAPKCRKIPISARSNSIKLNTIDETSRANGSRWGGVQSYWVDEADTASDSKPKFGRMELSLNKLLAFCYATDEVLDDTVALQSIVMQAFPDEIAFKVDDAVVRGTGVGQPLGILNSGALITVAKTSSQTADTVTYNNVQDMYYRMYARSRANSVWYVNTEVEPQLNKMTIATGTYSGATVYMPPTGVTGMPYATLFGRPVVPIEQCSALGDVGDIIFADLSQYLIIDKGGLKSAESIHVRFMYEEKVFRFSYRVDGQPMWQLPLTPFKGAATSTTSPFITLASRA